MPRSSRHYTHIYNDNFRPPPPRGGGGGGAGSSNAHYYNYSQHNPEVSAQFVFSFVVAALLILYHILHGLLRWPPPLELLFMLVGSVLGPGAREMLQNAFSTGPVGSVRARAASLVGGGNGAAGGAAGGRGGFVGGLWNMGNTCYQNSVLQAMASLSHLKPHLGSLSISEEEDYMNPSGALSSLIADLNTLSPGPRAFTPSPIIVRGTGDSGWIYNEQQDAQEYFQKLTGALEKEASRFLHRRRRSAVKGLEAIVEAVAAGGGQPQGEPSAAALEKEYRSPFEGLFAQRVGCLRCGYVESISMQPFTSLSLSLPSTLDAACTIEDCLEEFTALEEIQEVDCDKCTLHTLHANLVSLSTKPLLPPDMQSQIRARIAALEAAIDSDSFDPHIPGVKISPRSKVATTKTKQTMIARPPPVLVLHLNRSQYDVVTGRTGKNYTPVGFPARLDLAGMGVVTAHGGLTVDPARSMSVRSETEADSPTAAAGEGERERVVYELRSVIAHYGGHHNGHYVCYRKQHAQWYKISDQDVYTCEEQQALGIKNAFMLFYERVPDARPEEAVDDGDDEGFAEGDSTEEEAAEAEEVAEEVEVEGEGVEGVER